jgi:hypothetical protein
MFLISYACSIYVPFVVMYKPRPVPLLWNRELYTYFFPYVLVYHTFYVLDFYKYTQTDGHAIISCYIYIEFKNRKLKSLQAFRSILLR